MGERVTPLDDIEILQEMLISASQVPLQQAPGKAPSVQLTDFQNNSSAVIRGLPHDSIVIRAEDFEDSLAVFGGSKGERKRADFVIVSQSKKKWIVCIEIQQGDYKASSEVIQQLKGAHCFVTYCKCIGKEFWSERKFLEGYEIRYVSLVYTGMDKRRTRSRQGKRLSHDRPENYLKISGRSHHFQDLTNRPS